MSLYDTEGQEFTVGGRVLLDKDIEMERLFAGYDLALGGRDLPRDLQLGDEGEILDFEHLPEPRMIVEFRLGGAPFWRGGLRTDEVRRKAA